MVLPLHTPLIETPSGALHAVLEPSTQEGLGDVQAGPEEGHEGDQRGLKAPLLCAQAERDGALQPGEDSKETLEWPSSI